MGELLRHRRRSAAALTGLMFVVIAAVADAGPRAATPTGIAGFVTPTIIQFCAALLISAILSAPWPGHHFVQLAMGLLGLGGIVYSIAVWRRVRGITTYTMVTHLTLQRIQREQEKPGK